MRNEVMTEKEYQALILDRLKTLHKYEIREATDFDAATAMDHAMLFAFLQKTQEAALHAVERAIGREAQAKDAVLRALDEAISRPYDPNGKPRGGGLLYTLKHGFTVKGTHFDLMYTKPETTWNEVQTKRYEDNVFSVMKEVYATPTERVDLVVFLNGVAIVTIELKCNHAGQDVKNAVKQYREDRSPDARLFRFGAGAFVHFAMDLYEVEMTTKLAKQETRFLPFNRGCGEGVHAGKGNPIEPDKQDVAYLWEDILQRDTLLHLIEHFLFMETAVVCEGDTRETVPTALIFPRYHQLDLVRRVLLDVRARGAGHNYLVQHSPGSGKTNSIAWLSYRLSTVHDAENRVVFDTTIVVTDRIVVDRQLQEAILGLEHQDGFVTVMDDTCTSADLRTALAGNTKIIVTTIQKFQYIVDAVHVLQEKRFAVIIDEAHSSTTGSNMVSVRETLGAAQSMFAADAPETAEAAASDAPEAADFDAQDFVAHTMDALQRGRRMGHVSMFAFTATPKRATLRIFGTQVAAGRWKPFHLYSMKQAIEEEYILDVLTHYTTYQTLYRVHQTKAGDPSLPRPDAMRQIAQIVDLDDANIAQRIQIIVEHFRDCVVSSSGLGKAAKAMIVTASRMAAVKYRLAFDRFVAGKASCAEFRAVVAFSGSVKLGDTEYTEAGMNGFSEAQLPARFDTDAYRFLIVANKYQTGFDQKKLTAMYVIKPLREVNAVQTLSRLNRICPPYKKRVFVLDFANDYEDMKRAFRPYFTATMLASHGEPSDIFTLWDEVDAFFLVSPMELQQFGAAYRRKVAGEATQTDQAQLEYTLKAALRKVRAYTKDQQQDCKGAMTRFVKFYEFLLLTAPPNDADLAVKYVFLQYLLRELRTGGDASHVDLSGFIEVTDLAQMHTGTHVGGKIVSKPTLPGTRLGGSAAEPPKPELLSEILQDLNARVRKLFGDRFGASALQGLEQIKNGLLSSEDLRITAKNNSQAAFTNPYHDTVRDLLNDALNKGAGEYEAFYEELLDEERIRSFFDPMLPPIYDILRAPTPYFAQHAMQELSLVAEPEA